MNKTEDESIAYGVIAVTNSNGSEVRLILEPWAEEVVLSPDESVDIAFSGPQGGRMEVEVKPGAVILYGWEGSILSIKPLTPARAPSPST
ncbi:uncharacterized protein SOCE26_016490 [Sorangium cellulosum]|uniref:Uncharacterized protein n=1 Tax=Sorangium cellulosum TaxID=56 RepID=A0A2L0ELU2_SORCE|nr:hypothetical protein [Sorangium cellulosum]AUX40250.1 uncharacterized protein SOCE26_016490 [Sorangium cellulosum]